MDSTGGEGKRTSIANLVPISSTNGHGPPPLITIHCLLITQGHNCITPRWCLCHSICHHLKPIDTIKNLHREENFILVLFSSFLISIRGPCLFTIVSLCIDYIVLSPYVYMLVLHKHQSIECIFLHITDTRGGIGVRLARAISALVNMEHAEMG